MKISVLALFGILAISPTAQADPRPSQGETNFFESYTWKESQVLPGLEKGSLDFLAQRKGLTGSEPHVHMMHLDGFRPDLVRKLVKDGMMPHLALLLTRGKASFEASTTDKSETMKVVQSYMTSRLDTDVVGWWQFSRHTKNFRNFWMSPVEVLNYAIGFEFPRYPSLFDYYAAQGEIVTGGFNLFRRAVPFQNYSRNYIEGAMAVFAHTYFDQASATMDGITKKYRDIVAKEQKPPRFTASVLAPADEMAHWLGVTGKDQGQKCLIRYNSAHKKYDDTIEKIFETLDEDFHGDQKLKKIYRYGIDDKGLGTVKASGWFNRVVFRNSYKTVHRWTLGKYYIPTRVPVQVVDPGKEKASGFCFNVPTLQVQAQPGQGETTERASWRYVLGMLWVDVQLAKLIDTLRAIRPSARGYVYNENWATGLVDYVEKKTLETSLFHDTLFVFLGDHGMADSKHMMGTPGNEKAQKVRAKASKDLDMIQTLNAVLDLETADPKKRDLRKLIGIDDTRLPLRLASPHDDPTWFTANAKKSVEEARQKAEAFLVKLFTEIKRVYKRNKWYLNLASRIPILDQFIDKKFEEKKEEAEKEYAEYRAKAISIMASLYLASDAEYQKDLKPIREGYYRNYVRLVYGGGARNNAEIFLPNLSQPEHPWASRPAYSARSPADSYKGWSIMDYRAGTHDPHVKPLVESLRTDPRLEAVGLIFIRKENGKIAQGTKLPLVMHIAVYDRKGNEGEIIVKTDGETGERVYGYRVPESSPADPLGYNAVERGRTVWKTYYEWNKFSIDEKTETQNAVAGMGSYLYSDNPSIGDITLTHAQGWNFGGNAGGHGGIHRDEKLTFMMVSGPDVPRGELKALTSRITRPDGSVAEMNEETLVPPTILDAAPTIVKWLRSQKAAPSGSPESLSDFARNGFEKHLQGWVKKQRMEILSNLDNIDGLSEAFEKYGLGGLKLSKFRSEIGEILEFLPSQVPVKLPDYTDFQEDGRPLFLF